MGKQVGEGERQPSRVGWAVALRASKRQAGPCAKGEPKPNPKEPGRKPGPAGLALLSRYPAHDGLSPGFGGACGPTPRRWEGASACGAAGSKPAAAGVGVVMGWAVHAHDCGCQYQRSPASLILVQVNT